MQQKPHADPIAIAALRRLAGENASLPHTAGVDRDPPAQDEWSHTKPADLLPPSELQPFRETMQGGLSIREVFEPEVFRWFFGRSAQR
jgi:hypothetical protein